MGYAFISYSSKHQEAADAMNNLLDRKRIDSISSGIEFQFGKEGGLKRCWEWETSNSDVDLRCCFRPQYEFLYRRQAYSQSG